MSQPKSPACVPAGGPRGLEHTILAAWRLSASPTPLSADQGHRASSADCHINLIAHRKMLLENLRSVLEKTVDEAVPVGSSSGPSSTSHATLSQPAHAFLGLGSLPFLIHKTGSKEPSKIGKGHFGNCEVLLRCGTIISCKDAKL